MDGSTQRESSSQRLRASRPRVNRALATLTIQAGTNTPAATSAAITVGRYINFTPASAKRGTTVTVSGGGFTAGTSGAIKIGLKHDDTGDPGRTGGDFNVDSAGKLTGSFVASGNTRAVAGSPCRT